MTTVLAIDQGTSGTKAVVVNPEGEISGFAELPLQPSYLQDGGVEQDPGKLLASVLQAGRAACDQVGMPIDIVTLANQGESVLAWDPDTGRPLSPIIVWQDRRSAAICDRLAPHKEMLAGHTGLVLDPYFSAPKMTWLRENLTGQGVVTTTDSWILHHLTGAFVTDAATASRSLLADLEGPGFSAELLALFGLSSERVPQVLASDAIAGVTQAFGGKIPVGGLVVDQQAALLAQHCFAAGDAKCTFGTGAFLLARSDGPLRSRAGLAASVAWELRGQREYCLDGQIYTAGSAIGWLRRLGLIETAADLDRVAAASSDGAICIPAFAGLAAPWWNPQARASFSGLSLATGKGELVRALLEGIAGQVAELCALVGQETGTAPTRLKVDGGLTASTTLMQALADIGQLEVEIFPHPHATPLGAATLARLAANPGLSLAEATIPWAPMRSFSPQWSADRATEFRDQVAKQTKLSQQPLF